MIPVIGSSCRPVRRRPALTAVRLRWHRGEERHRGLNACGGTVEAVNGCENFEPSRERSLIMMHTVATEFSMIGRDREPPGRVSLHSRSLNLLVYTCMHAHASRLLGLVDARTPVPLLQAPKPFNQVGSGTLINF